MAEEIENLKKILNEIKKTPEKFLGKYLDYLNFEGFIGVQQANRLVEIVFNEVQVKGCLVDFSEDRRE
jgi:hypothetical protein